MITKQFTALILILIFLNSNAQTVIQEYENILIDCECPCEENIPKEIENKLESVKPSKRPKESLYQNTDETTTFDSKEISEIRTYDWEKLERPNFNWTNCKRKDVKFFEFHLLKDNKEVFRTKVRKNKYKHNKDLEEVYKNYNENDINNYSCFVTTYYKDCLPQKSHSRSFWIREGITGLEVFDIVCDEPPYDQNGNVRYQAKATFDNTGSANTWQVNTFKVNSALIPFSSLDNCDPLFPISPNAPLKVPAGATSTWCFPFSVPIGTSTISSVADGNYLDALGNLLSPTVESDPIDSLPPCICDLCEDWQFNVSNEKLWRMNTGVSNMRMRADIQILNADPISIIDADIVYVKHEISDTLCHTCTKNDDYMGLFSSGLGSGKINASSGWQNSGVATLYDENNDGYGNEFTWLANIPLTGVDMSTSKQFYMNLSLPKLSSLECCNSKFKVCVRYTFTDINCKSCDHLICYEYDSSLDTGGNGPVGSGGTKPGSVSSNNGTASPNGNFFSQNEDEPDNQNNSNRGGKHDYCDCYVEYRGDINRVSGIVGQSGVPCSTNPKKTKIKVTQYGSTLSWGQKLSYPGIPSVNNLPKGKRYHATVKSKFGVFWYTECGRDFTVDYDISGNLNFLANSNSFCINKPIIISTNVLNERNFRIEFYENAVQIGQQYVNRPLNSQEDIQSFAQIIGLNFIRGSSYEVKIIACNNGGCTKSWILNFDIKQYCLDKNSLLKDEEQPVTPNLNPGGIILPSPANTNEDNKK